TRTEAKWLAAQPELSNSMATVAKISPVGLRLVTVASVVAFIAVPPPCFPVLPGASARVRALSLGRADRRGTLRQCRAGHIRVAAIAGGPGSADSPGREDPGAHLPGAHGC